MFQRLWVQNVLAENQVQFPVPTSGDSQLSVNQVPLGPTSSSDLHKHLCSHAHTHTQTPTDIHNLKIIKNESKRKTKHSNSLLARKWAPRKKHINSVINGGVCGNSDKTATSHFSRGATKWRLWSRLLCPCFRHNLIPRWSRMLAHLILIPAAHCKGWLLESVVKT